MTEQEEYRKSWVGVGDNNQVRKWLEKAYSGDQKGSKVIYKMLEAFILNNTPGWPLYLRIHLLTALSDMYYNGIDGHKALGFNSSSSKRGAPKDQAWKNKQVSTVFHHNIRNSKIQAVSNAAEDLKDGVEFYDRYKRSLRTKSIKSETELRDTYNKALRDEEKRSKKDSELPKLVLVVENYGIIAWVIEE